MRPLKSSWIVESLNGAHSTPNDSIIILMFIWVYNQLQFVYKLYAEIAHKNTLYRNDGVRRIKGYNEKLIN